MARTSSCISTASRSGRTEDRSRRAFCFEVVRELNCRWSEFSQWFCCIKTALSESDEHSSPSIWYQTATSGCSDYQNFPPEARISCQHKEQWGQLTRRMSRGLCNTHPKKSPPTVTGGGAGEVFRESSEVINSGYCQRLYDVRTESCHRQIRKLSFPRRRESVVYT